MRFFPLHLLVLSVLASGEALAQLKDRAAEPTFDAPCATAAEFWQTLRETHGVNPGDVPLRFLRIFAESGLFHLELEAADGSQRRLSDPTCRTLFDTALVIAATAAHPDDGQTAAALVPPPPPPPAPPLSQEGATEPEVMQPEAPVEVEPEVQMKPVPSAERPAERQAERRPSGQGQRPRFRLMVFGGGGVSLAFAPAPAGFGELGVGLRVADVAVTLLGRYHPPTESLTHGTVGIRMESGGGRLGLGYFVRPWLRLDLGPAATLVEGRALGIARPGTASVWMAAIELEGSAAPWRSRGFSFEVGARGWVTLNTPRFEMDSGGEVFQIPRAGAAIFLRGAWQTQ